MKTIYDLKREYDNIANDIRNILIEQISEIEQLGAISVEVSGKVYEICNMYLYINHKEISDSEIPFINLDNYNYPRHRTFDIVNMCDSMLDDSGMYMENEVKIKEFYKYLKEMIINNGTPRITFDW